MFRQDCSHHLLTTILPFWENLTDWERGGWFGYVNHDLSVARDAHKGCILNSRILWTFSTAARVTGDKSLLRYARHRRKRPGLCPCARQGDGAFPPD